MDFETFEQHARRTWEALPDALKRQISAVIVSPERRGDPEFPEVALMGECLVEPLLAGLPEAPLQSRIVLYHGSFVEIAAETSGFDWAGEVEETLRHELRHHLDWMQGHDALGVEDDIQRENMLRRQGEPFLRDFHRHGQPVAPRVWQADHDGFLEVDVTRRDWPRLAWGARLCWRGWHVLAPRATEEELGGAPVLHLPYEAILEVDDGADPAPDGWLDLILVFRRRLLLARNPHLDRLELAPPPELYEEPNGK